MAAFSLYRLIVIPLFVGQINIKRAKHSLASERYSMVPSVAVFGLRFTWRRWRELL